jgi:pyruvate/2-oxoglutarate/acetoin dehydrogenase E1 component
MHKHPGRVIDTPISESGYIGAADRRCLQRLRPVAELMFIDFMGVCFDQIFNQAAKFRYMFGGKAKTPVVIRAMYGAGFRAAAQHSQCLYNIFTHIPGLKVVIPSNPYDAKGLLIQSIRDNDPVIFLEHKALYTMEGDVPEESYIVPFGEAAVVQEGDDVTIRGVRPHGELCEGCGYQPAQEGRAVRNHRPAHHVADGLRHHSRKRRAYRPSGHRR